MKISKLGLRLFFHRIRFYGGEGKIINTKILPEKPVPSSLAALHRMQAVKHRDTAPEIALRSLLHKSGLRFRVNVKLVSAVNTRADIVFKSRKIAIFIDGCFWHGCPKHGTKAKANAEFWNAKIKNNQERDKKVTKELRKYGWKVIRVWEHEVTERACDKIIKFINNE